MTYENFTLRARHSLRFGFYPTVEIFFDDYISEISQVLEKSTPNDLNAGRGLFRTFLYISKGVE